MPKALDQRELTPLVWGDGFEDDSFLDLVRVRSWESVSIDEYVMYFPKIAKCSGDILPVPLAAHLEQRIAERRFLAARHTSAVSGRNGARGWFLWRLCQGEIFHQAIDPDQERALNNLLVDVSRACQSGCPIPYDRASAIRLAFGAGINPGYLWSEASCAPDEALFSGWLGHLDRGRSALVPASLAPFLVELTLDRIMRFAGSASTLLEDALRGGAIDIVRRAARKRMMGSNPVVQIRKRRLMMADPTSASVTMSARIAVAGESKAATMQVR